MDDFSTFRHHLTADQIDRILQHGHWIPVLRGITQRFFDEHHPGLSWNTTLDVLEAAGVVVSTDSWRLRADRFVEAIHFDGPSAWAKVWIDGTVATA